MDIWGERHLVPENAPAALQRRVAAEIRRLAGLPWLGLHPLRGRWGVRAAAPTALEVYGALVKADGYSRAPTHPYLIVKVIETPRDLDFVRRGRSSLHRHSPGIKAGSRLA